MRPKPAESLRGQSPAQFDVLHWQRPAVRPPRVVSSPPPGLSLERSPCRPQNRGLAPMPVSSLRGLIVLRPRHVQVPKPAVGTLPVTAGTVPERVDSLRSQLPVCSDATRFRRPAVRPFRVVSFPPPELSSSARASRQRSPGPYAVSSCDLRDRTAQPSGLAAEQRRRACCWR